MPYCVKVLYSHAELVCMLSCCLFFSSRVFYLSCSFVNKSYIYGCDCTCFSIIFIYVYTFYQFYTRLHNEDLRGKFAPEYDPSAVNVDFRARSNILRALSTLRRVGLRNSELFTVQDLVKRKKREKIEVEIILSHI